MINMIEQTISVFDRVDILINSAGIINEPKPFHLMSEDEWAPLIETNLIGTFPNYEIGFANYDGKKGW